MREESEVGGIESPGSFHVRYLRIPVLWLQVTVHFEANQSA